MITANTSTSELPDDLQTLRQMVLQLLADADQKAREIVDLKTQLENLKRRLFGRKSEKFDPSQLVLFEELLQQVQTAAGDQTDEPVAEKARPHRKPTGRKALPEHLPVRTTELLPDQEQLICAIHGCEKQRIGQEVTEELEFVPASFYRHRIVRPKFACRQCEGNISIADLPARPIDKGRPGPGLLAHVLTSKYGDHRVPRAPPQGYNFWRRATA
jgi:transposase